MQRSLAGEIEVDEGYSGDDEKGSVGEMLRGKRLFLRFTCVEAEFTRG